MKEKTKKRLAPFETVGDIGLRCMGLLEVVGWLMVGNTKEARQIIREGIGK